MPLLAGSSTLTAQDPAEVNSDLADGSVADKVLTSGDIAHRGPVSLWTENVGDTPVHVIVVELKPASGEGAARP